MKARVAGIAGSVLALTVIGGFAAASTFQSDPTPAPVTVQTVQPTDTATVAPTETVAPVVVPTTVAPVPVDSTPVAAPVVAPTSEAPVAAPGQSPAPTPKAPAVGAQRPDQGNDPAFIGRYADGTPIKKDSIGNVIPLPPR